MQFSKLISVLDKKVEKDFDIREIKIDSREVNVGDVFVCIKGTNFDGHDYVNEAIERGASAIIGEREIKADIPCILVKNSRIALSKLANKYFDHPNKSFKLVGITGTNGKTTTTFIIQNMLECSGKKVGVIGTLGAYIGDQKIESESCLTTPDPIDLNRIFSVMAKNKVDVVVMEVSAHAIALEKLAGITFDIGVLTNITQDHLDFFENMDNYKKTKERFITQMCNIAIVNSDDPICQEIINKVENQELKLNLTSFGVENVADNFATSIHLYARGASYFLNIDDNLFCVNTLLCGIFNIKNALCAASVCYELGVDIAAIQNGINTMLSVPGRFNVMHLANMTSVVIDYAHTPDGLSNILSGVRESFSGKIICVFGCGGNRDKSKRPIMGSIAEKLSDEVIITSDNPRFEPPEAIINDILAGVTNKNKVKCITDRILAINYALRRADKNDVIVIAGKGAENYIDVMGEKIPYSDALTVEEESKKIFEADKCLC